jgi:hypothetical protein
MSQHEELSAFKAITDELIALLEPLSEDQVNQVTLPGSWSPGQLGEHLLKSYRLIDLSTLQGTPAQRSVDEKSAVIDGVFLDFTTKYQPPESIVPSTEPIAGSDLLAALRQAVEDISGYVNTHDLSFTAPEFEVIGFGDLTAQEWIRFLTAHSKRHVRQLRNILSHL